MNTKTIYYLLIILFSCLNVSAQNYLEWAKKLGGNGDFDEAFCIKKDANGDLYISGIFTGTVDFDPNAGVNNVTAQGIQDAFLLKLNNNGSFIWVKTFGGNSNSVVDFERGSIQFDNSGMIYLSGLFDHTIDTDPSSASTILTASHPWEFVIIKLNSNGVFLWSRKLSEPSTLNIDHSDNIIISGSFDSTMDMNPNVGLYNLTPVGNIDGFLIKLNSQGDFITARQLGGNNTFVQNAVIVEFDDNNNYYFSGIFGGGSVDFDPNSGSGYLTSSIPSTSDTYILKLDSNFVFKWVKQITCSYFGGITNLKVDHNFNIFYTIHFQISTIDLDPGPNTYLLTSAGSYDFAVSKLDSNGNFIWAKQIGGTGIETAWGFDLDDNKNLTISGIIAYDSVDMDPGVGVVNYHADSSMDSYILKLDSNGNYINSKHFVSNDYIGLASLLYENNNLYACGSFSGNADFDPGTSTYNLTSDSADFFVLKLSQFPVEVNNIKQTGNMSYPNPVETNLKIENENGEINYVRIFTLQGNCVYEKKTTELKTIDIDFSKFVTGVYYLQTSGKSNIVSTEKIVKR